VILDHSCGAGAVLSRPDPLKSTFATLYADSTIQTIRVMAVMKSWNDH